MRRGFWNLFRVEKEHLANCRDFKAIPDIQNLENKLTEDMPAQEDTMVNLRSK